MPQENRNRSFPFIQTEEGESQLQMVQNAKVSLWFSDEVQPHVPALRAWLHARFPWIGDIDDITQEASFRIWRWRMAGGEIKSAKAALFTTARNFIFDHLRRKAVVRVVSAVEVDTLSIVDEHMDTREIASTNQELEILADALRDLPERCRQVLTLRKMYGYPQKEVASMLGISEHTVHALVAKGMRRCAEHLRHRGINRNSYE